MRGGSPRNHGEGIQHSSDSASNPRLGEDGAKEVAEGDEGARQQPVEAEHDGERRVTEGVQANDGTQDSGDGHCGEVGQSPRAPVG